MSRCFCRSQFIYTLSSLDDGATSDELKRLQDIFQRYHDHEIEQVKRSSFTWMKGRLAEQQAKYDQLDTDWQEKNLESLAELHTSLILNFEGQRLLDSSATLTSPGGKSSILVPSLATSKKDQSIQTNTNDIKMHSPIEEIMIESVFASPVMSTFYGEEDYLDRLSDPALATNDLFGSGNDSSNSRTPTVIHEADEEEEGMIEPVFSTHDMSVPSSSLLHKDSNPQDMMRFEVPKELLFDYEADAGDDGNEVEDDDMKQDGSGKSDNTKHLHHQEHVTDPTSESQSSTTSNLPYQQQQAAEIKRLQQTIASLNLKQNQLTSEIMALRRAAGAGAGHPSPGPSPRTQQRVTLGRSYSNASSTASSTATNSGGGEVVSEQVALARADMIQQYQNLLNEFTVEHGREVERLKEGGFIFILIHFIVDV